MNGRKKERAADIVEEVLDASRIGRGQAREAQRSMKRRRSSQLPERQALVDTRALSIQSATLNSSRNTQWEIVHQNELRRFARSLLAHFKSISRDTTARTQSRISSDVQGKINNWFATEFITRFSAARGTRPNSTK